MINYTGMEVEHGHDTESALPIKRATSAGVNAINGMAAKAQKEHKQVRDKALGLLTQSISFYSFYLTNSTT